MDKITEDIIAYFTEKYGEEEAKNRIYATSY